MKIPGIMYIIVGVLVAGVSGYVYKFIPKDGQPNMSMALFFFIGMVFIIIGIMKLFFRGADEKSALKDVGPGKSRPAASLSNQQLQQMQQPQKLNRTEQQIQEYYMRQIQQERAAQMNNQQASHGAHATNHANHTNAFSQSHHYQGPMHHAHGQAQQPASHSAWVQCRNCSTANHSHSNYCHACGNRLR